MNVIKRTVLRITAHQTLSSYFITFQLDLHSYLFYGLSMLFGFTAMHSVNLPLKNRRKLKSVCKFIYLKKLDFSFPFNSQMLYDLEQACYFGLLSLSVGHVCFRITDLPWENLVTNFHLLFHVALHKFLCSYLMPKSFIALVPFYVFYITVLTLIGFSEDKDIFPSIIIL